MMQVSRRNFIGTAALGAAALTARAQTSPTTEADIFYAKDDWNAAAFRKLLHERRQIKQIFDVTEPDGENLALHIHNALTGLERGFGISSDKICMVAALRSEANILNFNDYVWKKYRLGELFKVNDPTTGKPAERNIYYPSHSAQNGEYATDDPNDPRSIDQDTSIASVQQLGVQLFVLSCCHRGRGERCGKAVGVEGKPGDGSARHAGPHAAGCSGGSFDGLCDFGAGDAGKVYVSASLAMMRGAWGRSVCQDCAFLTD